MRYNGDIMVIFHSPNINFALNRGLEDYFPPNMGDSQGLCWGGAKDFDKSSM